jgi:hypothetical protein
MSNFFSDTLKVADEKICNARWSCGAPGEYFRCGFCGYKFVVGDKYRALYTNDIPSASGNPLVCEKCNDTTFSLRNRWFDKSNKWKKIRENEFWFFTKFLK